LLNNKLEAFVSDFGTAKLLDPDSSNQTLVVGTYGYIATGELFFSCYNLYLYFILFFSAWPIILKHKTSNLKQMLDQRLPPPNHLVAQDIFLVATLAFACLHTKPTSRPTMKCVSQEFFSRKKPINKPLHALSLWQLSNHESGG
jgi:hypothetical protein